MPAESTRIIVEAELDGALCWSERYGVAMEWSPNDLQLQLTLRQPESNAAYYLRGRFMEYRALPPEWTFSDAGWKTLGLPRDFPMPVQTPFGAPIFINFNQTAVICAPFNRLAYADHSGPHSDWGGPSNWLNAGHAQIHAETIGDMLQAIYRDFVLTRERMANV